MYTLKGIFPEPKKEQKKNFIRENMKQLKFIQGKAGRDPREKFTIAKNQSSRLSHPIAAQAALGAVKSSPSNKSGKTTLNVAKTSSLNTRKKPQPDNSVRIKKGDMAEFLRRKEQLRQTKPEDNSEEDAKSNESSGRCRNIGCQTIESNLSQKFDECTKLTMLYPKKDDDDAKMKASGDSGRHRMTPDGIPPQSPRRAGDEPADYERPRSRLNAILERKDHNKDPYLPSGYQKGVLPKYLRERREHTKETEGARADDDHAECPSGHVPLPDNERKETLRMLRNSFAELVSELNKMPVKTDTLRMRNRKMELEKQLAKLEDGIKVFSRPKVFVKIGE